jgi:hypothetical protein
MLNKNNKILAINVPQISTNPCKPSPCGANSQCQIIKNGTDNSCSCKAGFVGSPPYCRPECINNDECSLSLSCINKKCENPCNNTCGQNAKCLVVNHIPSCICMDGYFGDPFVECNRKQCKSHLNTFIKKYKLFKHFLYLRNFNLQ